MRKFLFLILVFTTFMPSGVVKANAVYNGTPALGNERVVLITAIAQRNFGCSGSLISPRIVYTAAHCGSVAHYVWPADAAVGSSNSVNPVRVLKSFIPKGFSECVNCGRGPIEDFMILILEKDLADVRQMRIATISEVEKLKNDQAEVIQIGYGVKQWAPNNFASAESNFPERLVTKLRSSPFLQSNKEVENLLKNKPTAFINTLNSPEKTMCSGDSGGPLYFLDKSEYVYIGTLSATTGLGCQYSKDDPMRSNPYWVERTFGVYYVAANYQKMITDANHFLENILKNEKAAADSKIKSRTIACAKGSRIIKVRAVKPVCPKGYERK